MALSRMISEAPRIFVLVFLSGLYFLFNSDFRNFVLMVNRNIQLANNYVLPSDNEKLLEVNEEKMHDYGTYDFIIVGAGSAGTLLANRLTEISKWKILLLEAGGPETDFSDIPGMAGFLQRSDMNWGYYSVPQKTCCLGMHNQSCVAPRGKVLGGSSVINGKMYVRGNKGDFDTWNALGNEGWSYKEVLPYFMKTENCQVPNMDPDFHNKGGLLTHKFTEPTTLTSYYTEALRELGVSTTDYNGRDQIGCSPIAFTVNGMKTASGGRAFIDPFINRNNLIVSLNSFVTKLVINNKSKVVDGVTFIKNGLNYQALASKEVILSAGTFNTPQILMLSGIGPKSQLSKIGVDLVEDLPVGKYMQEHPMFLGVIIRSKEGLFPLPMTALLHDYLQGHRPYTNALNVDSLRFLNVDDNSSSIPNIQHMLIVPPGYEDQMPIQFNLNQQTSRLISSRYNSNTDFIILVSLLHQKSLGDVTLRSSNPKDFPLVNYNLFSDTKGEDIETMYKGILEAVKLLQTDTFKALGAELVDIAADCENFVQFSKEYWYCAIRHITTTTYHPVGTTRMGSSTKNSVVSPKLLVHGMKNLRVVDAGVIPEITSGNINAPTYMIAEKSGDVIKQFYGEI